MNKVIILLFLMVPSMSHATVKEFEDPRVRGLRMDRCLSWGAECEAPAAAQWCLQKGYSKAIYWEIEAGVGKNQVTRMLKSDELCNTRKCDAFGTIVCYRK